jgi:sulfite exporter TauE/SafE
MKSLSIGGKSLSDTQFYKRSFTKIMNSKSNMSFYLLGMLNGLLPCGFVYFFAITAASTASPIYGALVMFIFGLSTIPAMFGLGTLSSLNLSGNFRNMLVSLASIAVLFYGAFTIYGGYEYISSPEKTLTDCH